MPQPIVKTGFLLAKRIEDDLNNMTIPDRVFMEEDEAKAFYERNKAQRYVIIPVPVIIEQNPKEL